MTKLFKNNYFALHFLGMFATMLAPFFNTAMKSIVEEGSAGTEGEAKAEKALLKKIKEQNDKQIKQIVDAAILGFIDKEAMDKAFEELKLEKDTIKTLTEAVEKQGLELQKRVEQHNAEVEPMSKQIEAHIDKINAVKDGESHSFTIKTVVSDSSVTSDTTAMRLTGIGQIQTARLRIAESFENLTLPAGMGGTLRFIDQSSITRNAAMKAENTAGTESVYEWTEYSVALEKATGHIPLSDIAVYDKNWIEQEVKQLLEGEIDILKDQQLWSGTNSTPQVNGIYTRATAWTAATYIAAGGAKVQDCSLYDLITIIAADMEDETKYEVDKVFLNSKDILTMKLKKDDNNNYVLPPFVLNNGNVIDDVQVIKSSQVTQNTMVICDSRYGKVYTDGAIDLQVGYINTDFTQGQKRLKVTQRLLMLVRNANAAAFRKVASISTEMAAMQDS